MAALKCVLLVLLCGTLACAQRTFQRSCDCEYTKDGRCAYTLLLPAPGAAKGGDATQCPTRPKPDVDDDMSTKVMGQIEQLKVNITDLRLTSGDQARLLSQLQSKLMTQQELLTTLGGLIKDLPTPREGGSPQEGDQGRCEPCAGLDERVGNQQHTLEGLQRELKQTQTAIGQLSQSFSNIGELFSLEEITKMIMAQQNHTMALQRSMAEFAKNASMAASAAREREAQGFGCFRRGLLVSGHAQNVTNAAITASSRFNDGHGAERGRIYTQAEDTLKGAWCASESRMADGQEEPNAPEEWLQFDLGKTKSIFGVITKGRSDYGQWVTTYSLNYTETDPASEMTRWNRYTDVLGEKTIFTGNMDQNTAKVNMLWQPIRARYIRVIPLMSDSNKCMRADVIGCLDEQ